METESGTVTLVYVLRSATPRHAQRRQGHARLGVGQELKFAMLTPKMERLALCGFLLPGLGNCHHEKRHDHSLTSATTRAVEGLDSVRLVLRRRDNLCMA